MCSTLDECASLPFDSIPHQRQWWLYGGPALLNWLCKLTSKACIFTHQMCRTATSPPYGAILFGPHLNHALPHSHNVLLMSSLYS